MYHQCQIIPFLILKSDNLENSRTELKGIVLPVPSNQIKVTFIIILPFDLIHLWFFPVSNRIEEKCRWIIFFFFFLGGGGGGKGYVGPPLKLLEGGGWPRLFLCLCSSSIKMYIAETR